MAIYDLGTASLAANGEVTGVGTTWKAPLTLIRVGATIVFKTEPVQIYTISEIISDTNITVYNPDSETVPAGTGYAILAHDGITVQGLAQDVAETLRYYQSRETEVSTAVDIFKDFDRDKFSNDVSQVNTQFGEIVTIAAKVSSDASQVSTDKDAAAASAASASSDKDAAAASAQEAADYAASLDTTNLLRKDLNLSDVADKAIARMNLGVNGYESSGISVKNFGAVGDGVTDDGSAIQAAMDYCQQNKVDLIFPSGKYMISYPLIYRNNGFYNYSIIGSGGSSEIVLTTNNRSGIIGNDAFGIDVNQNAAIVVVTDTNQSKYCRISRLRFSTTANADYGIFLSITENSLIEDCFFEGFKFGIFDSGSWIQRISRCIARNVTDTGFYIADGTSTFITECYADHAERGYYLKAGYSSIQNSAADHCSRWSYFFGGGAGGNAETDAITVSMNNCGSENSGTGAAIYVDGRVSLGVSNYHAGNYEPYQTQKTPFLVDVSSRGRESNLTFNNVRCVNFEYLFNDSSSSGNLISLTNVTSRSDLTGKYLLSPTSKLIENSVDGVVVFTGNDQSNRIGLSGGDVKDGNGNNSYSGLRNSQVIYRATIPVNRDTGASSGIGTVSLPLQISSYSVSVCYNGNYEGIDSLAMVFGVTQKTSSGFVVLGTSAKSSQAWSTVYVDVIVYGV